MRLFLDILQFMTSIKVVKNSKFNSNISRGIVYFPVVGIVIGLILFVIYFLLDKIFDMAQKSLVISSVLVLLEVIITGGLHVDGFGDTFDGIFSYRSKEKILEIMKDPRLGTNSLVSIIFLIIFKILILSTFIDENLIWPIILMPVVGRFVAVVLTYKTEPARKDGMGSVFIGKCDIGSLIIDTGLLLLALLVSSAIHSNGILLTVLSLFSVGIAYILAVIIELISYKKINGITGDILGCGIELGELVFIIYIMFVFI